MPLPKWTCYQSSHHTSSHKRVLLSIVCSTVCLLIVGLLNCESRKHGLKCASAKHLLEEGMERVSPVRLAFLQTLTAWLFCCKGPKHQNHNSTCASLMALVPRSSGLPVALSAPRHGDFPRSISGSKLPVCSLRGHAFPALKEICEVKCNLQILRKVTTSKFQCHCQNESATNPAIIRAATSASCFQLCIAQSVSWLLACSTANPENTVSSVPLPNICWKRAWKEWAPFGWRSCKRSRHDFAAAKDQNTRTTTPLVLRWWL